MKTIVISNLHLGLDDRTSENVRSRPKLAAFIDAIGDGKVDDITLGENDHIRRAV